MGVRGSLLKTTKYQREWLTKNYKLRSPLKNMNDALVMKYPG
jgi:hypothetical protein